MVGALCGSSLNKSQVTSCRVSEDLPVLNFCRMIRSKIESDFVDKVHRAPYISGIGGGHATQSSAKRPPLRKLSACFIHTSNKKSNIRWI